ncbi:hypothetical protein BJY52DRAFT_1414561 [Lactarius psammicola]|nr:hypothetical protein BJY52DRAFT_1414561 [Lactarius psammicola]
MYSDISGTWSGVAGVVDISTINDSVFYHTVYVQLSVFTQRKFVLCHESDHSSACLESFQCNGTLFNQTKELPLSNLNLTQGLTLAIPRDLGPSYAGSHQPRNWTEILQDTAPISGLLGDLVSFATAQAFMYMDPKLGGLFLELMFRLQMSPKYTNPYGCFRYSYSADGLVTNNQISLAIKGIYATKAMSKMSSLNRQADWPCDRRPVAAYELVDLWTLGYNLFADIWLDTNVVESFVGLQWLNNSGTPVDNLSSNTSNPVSSWKLFVAAMTPNQDLSTNLISSVNNRGLKDGSMYFPTVLEGPSPAQGAMYASLVALRAPILIVAETSSKSHKGVVAGSVIGSVAALLGIGTTALVVWRQRRQSHRRTSVGSSFLREATNQGTQVKVSPFITSLALTEAASLAAGLVHRPSSPVDSPLPLQRVASFPVGWSSKELAQLRLNGSRPQPMDERPSNIPLTTATGRGAAAAATSSSEARGRRSENNFLDEIQQLPAERSESPPSYTTSGDRAA